MAVKRWVSNGREYIDAAGSPDSIILNSVAGESWTVTLRHEQGAVYSFVRPDDADSDNFALLSTGAVIFEHVGDVTVEHEYMPPPLPPYSVPPAATVPGPGDWGDWTGGEFDERPQIPQSEMQRRGVDTRVYRRNNVAGLPFDGTDRYVLSSGTPWGIPGYRTTIEFSSPFPSADSPEDATSDQIDDLLADPVALYEGDDFARTRIVDGEIVVPISDRVRTWTETHDLKEYMQVTVVPDNELVSVVVGTEPHLTGYYVHEAIGALNTDFIAIDYRIDDIPEIFQEEFHDMKLEYYNYIPAWGAVVGTSVKSPQYNPERYADVYVNELVRSKNMATQYHVRGRAIFPEGQFRDGDEDTWNTPTQTV